MLMKMREMMKRKEDQKGFTLVELIIVMAILAVLAGIAVPKFGSVLSDAKGDAEEANKAMIESAGELWYFQTSQSAAITPAKEITEENFSGIGTYLKLPVPTPPDSTTDTTKVYKLKFDASGNATCTNANANAAG